MMILSNIDTGIDIPGIVFADREQWGERCASLCKKKFWRRRPVAGMILAVDAADILISDPASVKAPAADLKGSADAFLSAAGYRVPVYLVLDDCDKIPGYSELLSDDAPIVGTLLCEKKTRHISKRDIFVSRCKTLLDNLSDQCLRKLTGTDIADGGRAKDLARLLSVFTLAEVQISIFIENFLGDSETRPPPVLGGFFFASSADRERLLGHLLKIIPKDRSAARSAAEGTRRYRVKRFCMGALVAVLWIAALTLMAGGALRDALYMRSVKSELSDILGTGSAPQSQFAALEELRAAHVRLRVGVASPRRLIFRTGAVRGGIMDVYLAGTREIMVVPTARRLEATLSKFAGDGGRLAPSRSSELTIDEYRLLYHTLEAYLILTGGSPAGAAIDTAEVADVFAAALSELYGELGDGVISENIRAVIGLAAAGHYGVPSDSAIVSTARARLARTPRASEVYRAVMDGLYAPRESVPIERIVGKGEILRYGREVSMLYTREGWERTVFPAFGAAAEDPFKNGWVMGQVEARFDGEKLLDDLSALYAKDLRGRWLDFIRNIVVDLPSGISQLAHDLEKLSARGGEIGRALAAVCSLAIPPPDASGPFDESRKTFGALEIFLNGGSFDDYRKALGEISEALRDCNERGGFAAVFSGRGDDPIKQCRQGLTKSYTAMPHELSTVMKRLLEAPLNSVEPIVRKAARAELGNDERSWFEEPPGNGGGGQYRLRF